MQNSKRSVWVAESKVRWANVVIMPYFPAIGQSIAEILWFNGFQMVAVRHLGFWKFDILAGLLWPISVTVSNWVPNGQTDMEVWPFFDFLKMAAVRYM